MGRRQGSELSCKLCGHGRSFSKGRLNDVELNYAKYLLNYEAGASPQLYPNQERCGLEPPGQCERGDCPETDCGQTTIGNHNLGVVTSPLENKLSFNQWSQSWSSSVRS